MLSTFEFGQSRPNRPFKSLPLIPKSGSTADIAGGPFRTKMRHWRERCPNDAQAHRYYGCIMVRIGIGVSSPRKICSPSGCQGPVVTRAKGAVASSG